MAQSKEKPESTEQAASVIALDKFILATRDSGYKGTASAISELVDNAIQASATRITITITSEGFEPNQVLTVSVLDDGRGMDPFTMRQALRFGGSSRFNDRRGLGRYGMGLPNSSLSQARRVEVFSWQRAGDIYATYLDVDEIAAAVMTEVPLPKHAELPCGRPSSKSGTLIHWTMCDRLDNRRVNTITRKLAAALGQTFRYFLWGGTQIVINGEPVKAIDPLFLRVSEGQVPAETYGDPLEYEVRASADEARLTGKVKVTFTLLPIHALHRLSNEAKRELGISKGAGVSVVRAGREVDYGWFFTGNKRRENYDDWFRCEVEFDPVLDEAFGITHTKQQIRPQQYLLDILSPDIEATAHALNARIRKSHALLQMNQRVADSEQVADRVEPRLTPIPARAERETPLARGLKKRHPGLASSSPKDGPGTHHRIIEDEGPETLFFDHAMVNGKFVLALNPAHPFYKKVYQPLLDSDQPKDKALRMHIEFLLIAAARSEATVSGKVAAETLAKFRREWSDTLAAFLTA